MQKTSKKTRTALDKSTNLVYNTGMRNNNNNTQKVNTMSNLDKLIQTFMKRGHSWSNSIQLAKKALRMLQNDQVVTIGRKFVRVDD